MPFDRLRITGAHHLDRADRQGRSRPVRRHVSPARRWLGACLAPAGGGASATTAAGAIPQHRTCPARSALRRTGRTNTHRGAAGASSLGDRGARGVVREHPSVLAGWNHAGAQRVHFATTDAGLAAFPAARASLHGTTDSERYLALISRNYTPVPTYPTRWRGRCPHCADASRTPASMP
ncbi:MAG: hypothetical protein JWR13_2036 [Mycobacterium sp.]|nr:hypothetical protein [Mycobacterium sp.]